MKGLDEARMIYIRAYTHLICAEASHRLSSIILEQVEKEIIKTFGKEELDKIKIFVKRCKDDE